MELLKTLGIAYITICTVLFTIFLINLIKNLRKEISKEKSKRGSDILNKMRLVYVEQVGDAVHMYDTLTDSFMLQATTKEELWILAETAYPGLKFFETTKEVDFSKDK
jgi:hypothetical protein